MSIILGALVLALSPHRADGQQEQVSSEIMAEDMAVEAAARGWLARIEQGDWRGSWNGASQAFRDLNTLEGWTAAARSAHGQLGPALSREVTEHKVVPVPPHGYRIVTFRTDFANRAGVIETLSLVEEDGEWKIAGIFIE